MNTLSKIYFHFVKKFLTKIQIYLWHLLIFTPCLQICPWRKRLIFVLIWFFIKTKKLKVYLSNILNNYLHFLLSHLAFFLMMFNINNLVLQRWVLHWDQQFTCEEFFDISITRINNKSITSLYCKKTFSGLYLNFNSFYQWTTKKGLIHNPLFCAYSRCADYTTLHKEIEFLKSIWQRNLFPLFFIDNCIKDFLDKLFHGKNKFSFG